MSVLKVLLILPIRDAARVPDRDSSLFAVSSDLRPKLRKGPQSSQELELNA